MRGWRSAGDNRILPTADARITKGLNVVDGAYLGKWLVAIGLTLAALGLGLWLAGKWGLPLGHLPGDLQLHGRRWTFFFPLTTCIVVSIVLTVIVNLVLRWFR